MAQNLKLCELDPEVKAKLKKFRLRKERNCAAVVMKIDSEKHIIILDEEHEDISLDDLQNELPGHVPRFIVYSYVQTHDDGRVSYPLCFIFLSPQGARPELQMLYAGSKLHFIKEAELTKVFEVRCLEELTEEWLLEKLAFFR